MRVFFSLPRAVKRLIGVVYDSSAIIAAFWLAYYTRLGTLAPYFGNISYWSLLAFLVPATVILLVRTGIYKVVLRYMSVSVLLSMLITGLISVLFLVLLAHYLQVFLPRTIPVLYGGYLMTLMGGGRLLIKQYINNVYLSPDESVIIYGAGSAGRQLVALTRQSNQYKVRALVDDDPALLHTSISGVMVFSPNALSRLIDRYQVSKVFLALPSATRQQRRSAIDTLAQFQVEVLTVPNIDEILRSGLELEKLREVAVEDLLGRDKVEPKQELLNANIKQKVVMVTGAGGSIGSELCRQILEQQPKVIILYEHSEYNLYRIERDLATQCALHNFDTEIVPLLADVKLYNKLVAAMREFKVQTVYHAAAYKHVPLVEQNVIIGVRNNLFGTFYAAKAACVANVESFVLISTDKAVRPTNVMGSTKRLAEMALQALATTQVNTCFSMVRFGNVLGSSGSVIPLFKQQIASGGPVTVTHPDIIRYFMTIPEAAQLVIQAGSLAKGGDVFVLDMGEPVKIAELAKKLVHLSGLEIKDSTNPDGQIEIQYTGLRPGEKLYEELLIGDNVEKTAHPRIMTANEVTLPFELFMNLLNQLDVACENGDVARILKLIQEAPVGYSPSEDIVDCIWVHQQARSIEERC